ncbi:hypothetical protein PR048_011706 [Dryococelus australis]|uniref:Mutator-like transposase domain-containing protein n=1 Tax=Dryococelus australis TaxID=614101 RepID=A0ABQ9HMD6_9NEOP|nr:hypothetical protein PR048_011706 [Dryococelus australis]
MDLGDTELTLSNEETQTTPSQIMKIEGRRIVDLQYFLNTILSLNHHEHFDCSFKDTELVNERRLGFCIFLSFKYKMCNITMTVRTDPPGQEADSLNVNASAVSGMITTGGGYSQLEEICAAAALAKEVGEVDKEGCPLITLFADGAWAKKSYKTKYDSLSGGGAIIGYKIRKIISLGVQNKYCSFYACYKSTENSDSTPEHKCEKNWTGTSSMEQDIIVDGFVQSMNMHSLKYNKLIGDGESSAHRKLVDAMPYGPDTQVQKIECRNHILKHYMNNVRDICGNTRLGNLQLHATIQTQAQHLRTAFVSAIKYRKDQESFNSNYERTEELRKYVLNSPYHVFGNHDKCSKHGETDLAPQLKAAGIWQELLIPVQRIASHATSFILYVDTNISENFNSVVAKTVGGKRGNFALRNSYQTRCEAAVVSINYKGGLHRVVHKSAVNKSPEFHTKKFVRRATYKRKISQRQRQDRKKIEEITRGQSSSHEWKEQGSKRITASFFGKICKLKPTTSFANTVKQTRYIVFKGKSNTFLGFRKRKSCSSTAIRIKPQCGYRFVDEDFPFLRALPDGLNVKCPASIKLLTPTEAVTSKRIRFMDMKNGNEKLKNYDSYMYPVRGHMYQVQGLLHIWKREYCYFVVWSPMGMLCDVIKKDDEHWSKKFFPKIHKLYFNFLLPGNCPYENQRKRAGPEWHVVAVLAACRCSGLGTNASVQLALRLLPCLVRATIPLRTLGRLTVGDRTHPFHPENTYSVAVQELPRYWGRPLLWDTELWVRLVRLTATILDDVIFCPGLEVHEPAPKHAAGSRRREDAVCCLVIGGERCGLDKGVREIGYYSAQQLKANNSRGLDPPGNESRSPCRDESATVFDEVSYSSFRILKRRGTSDYRLSNLSSDEKLWPETTFISTSAHSGRQC